MVEISRGQRLKLTDIIPNGQTCGIGLAIQAPGLTLDYSCFGIDAAGKLSDERYLTFYNQPASPCGGVVLAAPAGDQGGFTLNLQKLPATIDRLVFTVAIDGAGTMGQITEGYLRFLENSREVARFIFGVRISLMRMPS
jgi:tellurite resistance protein TerA